MTNRQSVVYRGMQLSHAAAAAILKNMTAGDNTDIGAHLAEEAGKRMNEDRLRIMADLRAKALRATNKVQQFVGEMSKARDIVRAQEQEQMFKYVANTNKDEQRKGAWQRILYAGVDAAIAGRRLQGLASGVIPFDAEHPPPDARMIGQ
eukprot:gnl/TRDRNA2_/TRDRNA2_182103_c1_seq1.p1 gnl/TRDRNA2_/TRDRNA2_182103_c1~~gnl/TRDRNA2_/TRDRNA2_182103_c1_seq1.p1  ORF type:complete len:149 (+),score=34.06 gnl/TRDRNA2_/TRDRNA2_182103_c1_seq1:2-448(+)